MFKASVAGSAPFSYHPTRADALASGAGPVVEPMVYYVPTYCNHAHRTDGTPVEHECRVVPPAAMLAELAGDLDAALAAMRAGSTFPVFDSPSTAPVRDAIARARLETDPEAARLILADAYRGAIGYDPWSEDDELTPEAVAETLSEWCTEAARDELDALPPGTALLDAARGSLEAATAFHVLRHRADALRCLKAARESVDMAHRLIHGAPLDDYEEPTGTGPAIDWLAGICDDLEDECEA